MTQIGDPLVLVPFTFLINYIDGLELRAIYLQKCTYAIAMRYFL